MHSSHQVSLHRLEFLMQLTSLKKSKFYLFDASTTTVT